ncbi:MAG: hypothetical protein MUC69_02885 [Gemmatimonadales bacterium]|nr:hypothetical protein [Gemmatimonadales bacterium]
MITTLALRHLLVRKVRAAVLLLGFALGVGVMIVLLSVGEAMLAQSRDVSLVGGGEVTVLPQGIDVEAMRTGGVSGMFFGIDRARAVVREFVGGARHAGAVEAVAPAIELKLLYLGVRGAVVPVKAGGEIPSRAAAVGTALDVREGAWVDSPADSAYVAPTRQQLYDELDRFHLPATRDSTWGEWHYFNVVTGPDEWWYITFLVGGEVPDGRWGGQLLVTRRRPDGVYERFVTQAPSTQVRFDTARADLELGGASVTQRDGRYRIVGTARGDAGVASFELGMTPAPRRYFPPVELRGDGFVSGYVVPGLRADAEGTLCVAGRCRTVRRAPAYHDHNWGVWRDVSWEWGMARGASLDLLYGGVRRPDDDASASPYFLALVDSLGVRQVLRFRRVAFEGSRAAGGAGGSAPERFTLVAAREADTVRLSVEVLSAQASRSGAAGLDRRFLQLRGAFRLEGRVAGAPIADEGLGFFETYVER